MAIRRNLGNVGEALHACYAPVHVGKSAVCKEWKLHTGARACALSRERWRSGNQFPTTPRPPDRPSARSV